MPTTVTMPQLGETVVEGTILKWLKKEGEEIGLDEPLFEISTDKVDTEVPSPVAGTVSQKKVEVSGEAEASQPDESSAEEAVAMEVAEQPEKPAKETEREMQPAASSG